MATERIATFVEIFKVDDQNQTRRHRRYHNATPGAVITLRGQRYSYLPFLYSGGTVSRTGDNVIAELTLSSNDIAASNVAELVEQNYRADVTVCRMNNDFTAPRQDLTRETWLCSSAVYDSTAIQVSLSSGIDAVNANTPRRVLTSSDVGPLPITGNVKFDANPRNHRSALPPWSVPEKHGQADCLSMCRTVLSHYNISTPEPKRDWYRRLRRGDYSVFKEELEKWGEETTKMMQGTVALCEEKGLSPMAWRFGGTTAGCPLRVRN